MSKKIVRFQIQKDQVNPTSLPELPGELRSLIQRLLFEWLRKANDDCEKTLKLNSQESADTRSRYPEIHEWKNPSDSDLLELIQNHESADEDGRGGWEYSVKEEALCVNGTLTIYVVGHKSKLPMSSWMQFPEFPKLRLSEEVSND